jgi:y4mF family transcriptional regulator
MNQVEMDTARIAKKLKDRRKELRVTQADLALVAGVSRRLIVEFENGKSTISLDRVLLITKALGLKLDVVSAHAR